MNAIHKILLAMFLIQAQPALAPWTSAQIEEPATLVSAIKAKAGGPVVIQIGFETLYKGAHISKSDHAGPASTPEGLELLRKKLAAIPRDADIVLYCGCCPWDKCPNMRPAFKVAQEMGFTKVKVLMIKTSLNEDWISKGYPTDPPKP